jgi:hypothetical protein
MKSFHFFYRASGEKCFINPKGFIKFFECKTQALCERFCGGVVKIRTVNLPRFGPFFFHLCGKMSQKSFVMKSAVKIFSMKSAVKIFFNEISSGNCFSIFFQ